MTCKTWQTQKRNVQIGDNVHLRYDNGYKGYYCLAKVVKLNPDTMSMIRSVQVFLRKKQDMYQG